MTGMPENYILEIKDIKHARIRVSENGDVRILIPNNFTEEDVSALLTKKKNWIEKQSAFFKRKKKIELGRNQLLLFGNRYSYFYDETYKYKIIVDHNFKTIRSRRNLLDLDTQTKWYRNEAKKYLIARVEELANKLNFYYSSIYIRDQKTKLGNCSSNANISLNWRLIKAQ